MKARRIFLIISALIIIGIIGVSLLWKPIYWVFIVVLPFIFMAYTTAFKIDIPSEKTSPYWDVLDML